jgi:hypothetical protein
MSASQDGRFSTYVPYNDAEVHFALCLSAGISRECVDIEQLAVLNIGVVCTHASAALTPDISTAETFE